MRKASTQKHLIIALEPECASLHVRAQKDQHGATKSIKYGIQGDAYVTTMLHTVAHLFQVNGLVGWYGFQTHILTKQAAVLAHFKFLRQ